jgi:hypothetical protein
MKRSLLFSLVVASVVLLVGPASAAPATYVSGNYSGHTSQSAHGQKLSIKFTVVKPAHGSAYVTGITYKTIDKCTPHGSVTSTHLQANHIRISAGGNFTDSHAYGQRNKNHVKLTGHLNGTSASGTVADDNVAPPPACHGKATWTATH